MSLIVKLELTGANASNYGPLYMGKKKSLKGIYYSWETEITHAEPFTNEGEAMFAFEQGMDGMWKRKPYNGDMSFVHYPSCDVIYWRSIE